MIDPRLIRNELDATVRQLARRGFELDTRKLEQLEARRKTLQMQTQELQAERNARSKSIGQARAKGENIEPLRAAVADLGGRLSQAESALGELQIELNAILSGIPNLLDDSVPDGRD